MTNGNRKDDKQGEHREEKTAAMATKEEEKVKPTAASTGEEDSKASAKKLMHPPTATAKKLAESDAIQAAVKAGNINIHREEHTEIMDLTEESKEAQEEHARLLKKVETERRARTIAVPTKAEEVSRKLRELGQPIRLFGEKPADIRERLQRFVAAAEMEEEETEKVDTMVKPKPSFTPRRMQMAGETADAAAKRVGVAAAGAGSATALPKKVEAVYTPASEALLEARRAIATTSFARAKARLVGVKRRRGNADEALAVDRRALETFATMRQLVINSSQFADDRPLSAIQVSPDGGTVASGSWTCLVKLWDFESLEMRKLLRGHTERVTGIAWHPNAYTSGKALLASGAADKSAKVWDCESGECVQTLHGHAGRLARIGFHPTGRYLGTASFDHTWRLWDVETGDELLLQDGHHKEVYGISFQADGALVATGDLGGTARVWDLRSGRSVWTMEGHVKRITCVDFSPCCYEVASGSDDHTVRIWDIRKQRCAYTLPAHSALVSDVRYGRASGEVLVSASFDNSAKVWSTRDWSLLRTLSGHEGKLTGCDVTPSERKIVTCSFDRTVKVWAHQDEF